MDFVTIVTPNFMHFPVAKAALEAGFPVVCDKPLTMTLAEAKELATLKEKTGLLFAVTQSYTGYPMVKEARNLVASGKLGKIRKSFVEYPQGWLNQLLENTGNKQASWRTDPKRAGASSSIGDIGSHAQNLLEYVTGLKITELCADLTIFVPGRQLDDDASVLLRMEQGAKAVLTSSQIAVGVENGLALRVYGEVGGLEWRQEEPNSLLVRWPDRPPELYRTGGAGGISALSKNVTRLPAGHPEGYIEAFANLYRNIAQTLDTQLAGGKPTADMLDFPTVYDGVRGMAFIETVVESAKSDRKWTRMKG